MKYSVLKIKDISTSDIVEFIISDDGEGNCKSFPKDETNADYQAYLESISK